MSVPMAEKIAALDRLCTQARILPVITVRQAAHILPLADALAAGGLSTLEITLRSEHGLSAIRTLRRERPQLCVGVGTVLDRAMLAEAEGAGAQFVVSPGCTAELLQAGLESPLPLLPGASSASDLMLGHSLGYRRFKLFPAEVCGGVAALRAFAGPFPGIRFCPTGGLRPGNLWEYMRQPNVMCVGGTWMLDAAAMERGDWASIERLAGEALALLG
ncbi:bifunctional 4-hydroxy-2-oxoglutarate aldolase/2-dehydro-3-deoxy-phosphogluconate aldolase [Azotobacter salinestris]